MYGLYDFQDRISEVHKDMLRIYDVDCESKQKVEQLEKETNDLLDEICKKLDSEIDDENNELCDQLGYLDHLERSGRKAAKAAVGTINYLEQLCKVNYSPKNIDYLSKISYESLAEYIQHMEDLSNNISSETMNISKSGYKGMFGKLFYSVDQQQINHIFNSFEELMQMDAELHDVVDGFVGQIYESRHMIIDEIKSDADEKYAKIIDDKTETWNRIEKNIENKLDSLLSSEYLYGVKKHNVCSESSYFYMGRYCYYLGWIDESTSIYQSFKKRYSAYIKDKYLCVDVPYNLQEQHSFVFNYTSDRKSAVALVEKMLLNQLKVIEVGLNEIVICSCKGSLDGLDNLNKFCKSFPETAKGVLVKNEDIKEAIWKFTEVMNDILQNKLVQYSSVEEFNKNNSKKIPYRTLFIMDYEFDYLEKELSILIEQGYKAGIQVFLLVNVPKSEQHQEIMQSPCAFNQIDYFWRNRKTTCLDLVPDLAYVDFMELYNKYTKEYTEMLNKSLRFGDIILKADKYSKMTKDILSIPVGINENGGLQCIEMGNPVANGTSHYGIIVGPTGSGKSTLLHTIVMSSILNFSPDELELYLLDFKEGNEFKIYEDKKIPHLKCLGLDAMQEFGESVLQSLWEELERRNKLFAEASRSGQDIKDITAYREAGYKMPRILVIMDEFQVLFDTNHNKNVAYRAAAKMSDFVSRGRVYGIHFLLATQTLKKIFETSSLYKGTLEEMHIRIGLQCTEDEFVRLMGDDNAKKCTYKSEKKKGYGIYLENDIVSEPISMQVAYLESDAQKELLAMVENDYEDFEDTEKNIYTFKREESPVISKTDIENMNANNSGIVIGEPIGMGERIAIKIGKKKKSDMLIVGEKQESIDNIAIVWIQQVLAYVRMVQHKRLYLFDGSMMIDEPPLIDEDIYMKSQSGMVLVDNIFRVLITIDELYNIFTERKQRMMHGIRKPEDNEIIYVVVSNYQWIEPMIRVMEQRDVSEFEEMNMEFSDVEVNNDKPAPSTDDPFALVNSMMDDLNEELHSMGMAEQSNTGKGNKISYSKKLKTMLTSGYFCGMHFMFTCQDASYMKRLGSSELSVFHNRILFKSPSKDTYAIIDTSVDLEKMDDNMAVFSDGVNEPELFRPYLWVKKD